jgi:hypothetical protein
MARVSVKSLPVMVSDEVAPSIEHWLFCNVPATPSVIEPCQLLASSFTICKRRVDAVYNIAHELGYAVVALICIHSVFMSAAPFASVNANWNTWLPPTPVLGVTDTGCNDPFTTHVKLATTLNGPFETATITFEVPSALTPPVINPVDALSDSPIGSPVAVNVSGL